MTLMRATARIDEAPRKPPILAALQGFAARGSATGRSRLPDAVAEPATPLPALQGNRTGLVRPGSSASGPVAGASCWLWTAGVSSRGQWSWCLLSRWMEPRHCR